jgi:hypothetical protein
MLQVPEAMPVTKPLDEPTVAIMGFEELHVPPGVAQVNVEVPPGATVVVPIIGAGAVLTVTGLKL